MNNEKEQNIEGKANEDFPVEERTDQEKFEKVPGARPKKTYIIGSLVLLAVSALLIWLYLSRDPGSGRDVPAPRNISFNDGNETDSAAFSGEPKITLSEAQLKAAGLKIETVGEDLSAGTGTKATTGVVQPNDYRETPVMSLVGGVARQVPVELGQTVRAGQPVAVIDSDELARAEADYLSKRAATEEAENRYRRAVKLTAIAPESRNEIDRAEAELKIAEAEHMEHLSHFQRSEKLLAIGAVSREEFEMVRSKHETARAKMVEAKNRFERAEKLLEINPARRDEQDAALAGLRTARAEMASMRQKLIVLGVSPQKVDSLTSAEQISSQLPVVSPVSGTVTVRKVDRGETVSAGAELIRVTNLSTVWVIGQVYEKDLANLRVGSGASITSEAFPGEVFRGNISYIDPNLDQTTRTAQVRIELPNAGERLKIGMYVNIAFAAIGGSENTVPTVPKEAIQNLGNRQVVFLATDQPNVFVIRPVRIGQESGGRFPVLEGLFVGDKVVTEGSFLLRAEWQKTNPG
ncbi:MAG: efflux RND transporter periplasmic adaptor subunit [Pyrinomonadaceae bacterium]